LSTRPIDAPPFKVWLLVLTVMVAGCGPTQSSEGEAARVLSEAAETITLRYLGAAGWEITAPSEGEAEPVIVLVDPYLTSRVRIRPTRGPSTTAPIRSSVTPR
jgi:predicted component of type VI protein secretion system